MKKIIFMLIAMVSLFSCKSVDLVVVDVYPRTVGTGIVIQFNDGSICTSSVIDSLYCVKVGDVVTVEHGGGVYVCDNTIGGVEIVSKNVNGDEIAYTFNTNDIVVVSGNKFFYYDRYGRFITSKTLSDVGMRVWHNCEVGQTGRYTFKNIDLPICMDRLNDYVKERVVTKVTKYDGHYSKIDGSLVLNSHLLSGSSGNGKISGESVGGENFFINIYFKEGDPISVNAKDNPLWLDVAPGNIVIETRCQNKVYYSPKL